jgi:hypothetical protein
VSNGGNAVRLERPFEADIDRVFRAQALDGHHLELIHQRLPAGADPHQYQHGWDAALASLSTASMPSSSTPPATAAGTSRLLNISSSAMDSSCPARLSSTAPPSLHSRQVDKRS